MNHGWEKKRLGDACKILSGYTPPLNEILDRGEIPFYKVAEMAIEGNKKFLSHTPYYLTAKYKTFPESSIVFPKNGAAVATNKKRILSRPSAVDLNTAVAIPNSDCILPTFAYYLFQHIDFNLFGKRGAVPTLDIQKLKSFKFFLPKLSEQQTIVAELDALNEAMEVKRKQLKALNALAQAIFYDTFGDPIENSKGWEITPIRELILPKSKIARVSKKFSADVIISYVDISSIDNKRNTVINTTTYKVCDAPSRAQQIVSTDDILVGLVRPNLRNIAQIKISRPNLVASTGFIICRASNKATPSYLKYLFLSAEMTATLCAKIAGQVYPAITEENIRSIQVGCPPLSLQQQFAAQVEEIEREKENVEATIARLQTLLDSRMDYWFND